MDSEAIELTAPQEWGLTTSGHRFERAFLRPNAYL